MSQDLLNNVSAEKLYGKSGWFEILPLESASEATRTSGEQHIQMAEGVILQVIIDNVVNTPTFTPTILLPSADTAFADEVLAAFSAIGSSGSSILAYHPAAAGIGDSNIDGILPSDWKLSLVYAGADTTHVANTRVFARYI